MTREFWLGMLALPATAAAIAIAATIIVGAWWRIAAWGGDAWRLWPSRHKNAAAAAALVASSKRLRRIYLPGLFIVVARIKRSGYRSADQEFARHLGHIQYVVQKELDDPNGKSRWDV